jgi:hypothetical protein
MELFERRETKYTYKLWLNKIKMKEWFGMRFSLFWDVAQRRLVINYRRFGTTKRSFLQGPSSKTA